MPEEVLREHRREGAHHADDRAGRDLRIERGDMHRPAAAAGEADDPDRAGAPLTQDGERGEVVVGDHPGEGGAERPGKARDEAAAATSRKLAEADAALEARTEAAAQALAGQRAAVVAELDQVAADAAAELVKRVSGLDVSNDEAANAVKKVAA